MVQLLVQHGARTDSKITETEVRVSSMLLISQRDRLVHRRCIWPACKARWLVSVHCVMLKQTWKPKMPYDRSVYDLPCLCCTQLKRTPLHTAARLGHVPVVKYLLSRGAKKEAKEQVR